MRCWKRTALSSTAECVICAVGRVPNVEGLGLEKAGVRFDEKGIPVNEYMRATNPRVYACGDVLAKEQPRLTPVAKAKLVFEGGLLVGAGLLGGQADDLINYLAILIGKRVTHQELERMIFAWPTTASDLSSLV